MRTLKASLAYFFLVFATGFALGAVRVTLVVPQLGVRWAELLEMPLMLVATFFAARFCLRHFGSFTATECLMIGAIALVLLIAAELGLTIAQGRSISEYFSGRDLVSGTAYFVALVIFAVMPPVLGRSQRANIHPS